MADLKERLLKESVEAAKKKAAEEAEKEKAGEASAGDTAENEIKAADTAEAAEKAEETVEAAEKVEGTVEDALNTEADQESELPADDGPTATFAKGEGDKKDAKIVELNDRLIRNLAEFDNFRKRTDKEKSQMFEMGAKSIIEKILPAIDSFELGLAAMSEEDRASGVGQGMEKIYKQLMTILENAGVKQIEALGKEFDPNLHNAVMHEENEEFGENTVSQELQKGYMYNDSVIRHSMVKVAN
ncbi:MAG: nucleotide exchange factor GrpE [Lachnospiraceae bacterium]|nr:nucleotide exchange factor GrpE [Lachnospiraceae bacterium]